MGKRTSDLTDGLMSIAKAMPLILGATGGFFIRPHGGSESPFRLITQSRWNDAYNAAIVNYTFVDYEGNFQSSQGVGVKAAVAGVIVYKLLGWLT